MSAPTFFLGVDVGGTKIAAALGDSSGSLVAEITEPTDERGGLFVVEQIVSLSGKLKKEVQSDDTKIRSVMVGIPGVIDPHNGKISHSPNVIGLAEIHFPQEMKNHFGALVAFENDVNLAMLGEVAKGNAHGYGDAALLALGTGVGLGLMVNGRLLRGNTGAAGEIAYLPVGKDVTSPNALNIGSFELEVGSKGIVQRYNLAGTGQVVASVRDVFMLLEKGDNTAALVIDGTAQMVARAIAAVQSILDLEIIVLGGSIGIRPELVSRVQRDIGQFLARPVHIAASLLGSRAGVVGAVQGAIILAENSNPTGFVNPLGVPQKTINQQVKEKYHV